MFLLSPSNICVSLATNFIARYKVSEVAKLGDTEGTSVVVPDMSPSLARPLNTNQLAGDSGRPLELIEETK